MKKKHTIIFLHIPKTAGTTFRLVLDSVFAKKMRAYIYPPLKNEPYYKDFINNRNLDNYDLISGHIKYGVHSLLDKNNYSYITFFREPIKNVISHYNHVNQKNTEQHQKITDQYQSLEAYLNHKMGSNLQVRYLVNSNNDNITEEDLDKALELIETKIEFGLVERFDESVYLLSKKLKWDFAYYTAKQNIAKNKKQPKIDADLLAKIKEANKYDILLYEKATELFNERIRLIKNNKLGLRKYLFINKLRQNLPYIYKAYKLLVYILKAIKLNPERI